MTLKEILKRLPEDDISPEALKVWTQWVFKEARKWDMEKEIKK